MTPDPDVRHALAEGNLKRKCASARGTGSTSNSPVPKPSRRVAPRPSRCQPLQPAGAPSHGPRTQQAPAESPPQRSVPASARILSEPRCRCRCHGVCRGPPRPPEASPAPHSAPPPQPMQPRAGPNRRAASARHTMPTSTPRAPQGMRPRPRASATDPAPPGTDQSRATARPLAQAHAIARLMRACPVRQPGQIEPHRCHSRATARPARSTKLV